MRLLTTAQAINIWLGIPIFWLILSAYELGAIITHRWHTLSYLSGHNPWLAWLIATAALTSALFFVLWWFFLHLNNPDAIPW